MYQRPVENLTMLCSLTNVRILSFHKVALRKLNYSKYNYYLSINIIKCKNKSNYTKTLNNVFHSTK